MEAISSLALGSKESILCYEKSIYLKIFAYMSLSRGKAVLYGLATPPTSGVAAKKITRKKMEERQY